MSYPSGTVSTGGYTCAGCGTFIGYGAYHSCPSTRRPDREVLALERIATALEKLAAK